MLDTNVLVAGLLNPHGPPGRIVDLWLAGELDLVVDDRILAEYREVLARPKFGFEPRDVAALMALIAAGAEPVAAEPLAVSLPDLDDLPFLEVAVAADGATLVTGNLRHFPAEARSASVRVEDPAGFVEGWLGRRR